MTRGTTEYDGTPHQLLATLTDEQLCQIVVHREATARKWLGAANTHDASREVVKHFARQVKTAEY
jgi:hypothetical protein